ncbi:RES family NAD+ phosphorylase [Piscinibacter sp.]|jgi:hypothetical protein|uniref:RES family NAD+ phosphorylase n=1 Tax=Piscinibacter sp. TaxID=1903157 RepID=UPI003559E384
MLRPPDPGSFERLIVPVEVPTSRLWRLSFHPTTEPWFGKAATHRFDDPLPDVAGRYGVLYAGEDVETAFCESVIHESSTFIGGRYVVARSDIDRRYVVRFSRPAGLPLQLADFSGDALKAMGLTGDISAGDAYERPQLWSRAVHEAVPSLDGIRYRSRQRNEAYCYAIFERSGLQVANRGLLLADVQKSALVKIYNVHVV